MTPYENPADQPRLVGRIVGRLLNQRFRAQDIAVLSCRGLGNTSLKDVKRVGNHTLARFTGEYDMFGNQTYSKGLLRRRRNIAPLDLAQIRGLDRDRRRIMVH